MNDKAHNSKARLVVRPAALSDIDQIAALSKRVFGDLSSSRANIAAT
jgi:hypothetical protein